MFSSADFPQNLDFLGRHVLLADPALVVGQQITCRDTLWPAPLPIWHRVRKCHR
jgi:hypothetical protein